MPICYHIWPMLYLGGETWARHKNQQRVLQPGLLQYRCLPLHEERNAWTCQEMQPFGGAATPTRLDQRKATFQHLYIRKEGGAAEGGWKETRLHTQTTYFFLGSWSTEMRARAQLHRWNARAFLSFFLSQTIALNFKNIPSFLMVLCQWFIVQPNNFFKASFCPILSPQKLS